MEVGSLRGPMQYRVRNPPSNHCLKCLFSNTQVQLPCWRRLHRSASAIKCSEDNRLVKESESSSNCRSTWRFAICGLCFRVFILPDLLSGPQLTSFDFPMTFQIFSDLIVKQSTLPLEVNTTFLQMQCGLVDLSKQRGDLL